MTDELNIQTRERTATKADISTAFMGEVLNKVDAKGRMSVPPDYRKALLELNGPSAGNAAGAGILYVMPSLAGTFLECGGADLPQIMLAVVAGHDAFSPMRQRLEQRIFAKTEKLAIDGDGRVILSETQRDFAGITRQAMVVGYGNRFQLYEPTHYQALEEAADAAMLEAMDVTQARSLPSVSGHLGFKVGDDDA